MSGAQKPDFSMSSTEEIRSGNAFIVTLHWQTSRDLVEEWIVIKRKPLCSYYRFKSIVEMDGNRGTRLNCRRLESFLNDPMFVNYVEHETTRTLQPLYSSFKRNILF
jgi:hypothetical protein